MKKLLTLTLLFVVINSYSQPKKNAPREEPKKDVPVIISVPIETIITIWNLFIA